MSDESQTHSQETGLHILLVEDHRDTRWIISKLLEREGHQVQTAEDLAAAQQQLTRTKFDLLICDLSLPDGSGLDLMRQLRREGSRVPGIAFSGYGRPEDL